MKRQWTKAECTRVIEEHKDNTAYFDKTVTMTEMYEMFRDMQFVESESRIIIAALIKSGAQFKADDDNYLI